MPRRRKNSYLQRRERNKELKRQTRRKEKDDSELLTKSDSNGLNFPKKAENGLNFPKKAENGLNFPKKAENGLNFPKKSENGLNFPKKSENGLNFPKKSETAEDDMPVAAKCCADSIAKLCTDSDAKTYANAVTQSFTESSLNFAKCFPKECLNVSCDFDDTFADAYPNDVAYINCTTYKNLSLNEEVIIQNTDIEMVEPDPEIEVTSCNGPCSERFIEDMDTEKPLLLQPNVWNAEQIICGSFHQNDNRFLDQSRGFQCTCNALCMLVCEEIKSSSELDKILFAGDVLYNTTVNNLKAQGKFVNSLLSLEEIPDTLEFETVNFLVEKQPITCGTLVSTIENQALPSLHCALETAFTKSTSVLLISGAVCSAVHKRNNLYIFFDSHSHGEDCLSSSDGTSILMSFSCLEDLMAYLYAFYESMRIDLTMQFDLLPISVRKKVYFCTQEKPSENLLEAYFYDQTLRQKQKAVTTKKSETILNAKKKKDRKEYYRIYRQNVRQQNSKFKAKELVAQRKSKQNARQDRDYKAKELLAQRKHMHKARQDRGYKAKELVAQRKSKQNARQDRGYKVKELVAQRKSKQNARQDRGYKVKELVAQRKSKQNARQDRDYKAKELLAQRKHMHKARQDRGYKAKELVAQRKSKHNARQDRGYKVKELVAQRKSKQNARQDRDYKAKELLAQRKHMHKARQDRDYTAKELVAQRKSKQNARKNPFVLECERVKKQETRKKKRKIDEMHECIVIEETSKKHKNKLGDHRDIKECIKQFHSSIAVGPLFVCTCCHQTWFRKGVCMLKTSICRKVVDFT